MSIFKNVQTMRGIRGGHMRKPLLDIPEAEVEALKAAMEAVANQGKKQ